MTREEKCKLAIERGYTYEPETGLIYNRFGKLITYKSYNRYVQFTLSLNNIKYKVFAHQFAWYWVNKECVEEIDHINSIKYDNRIKNLRAVTKHQNQWNRQKVKGYWWNKSSEKYRVQITFNKKNLYLGLFETEEEARNAYLAAKQIYHVI
jgi:hypothetical protein